MSLSKRNRDLCPSTNNKGGSVCHTQEAIRFFSRDLRRLYVKTALKNNLKFLALHGLYETDSQYQKFRTQSFLQLSLKGSMVYGDVTYIAVFALVNICKSFFEALKIKKNRPRLSKQLVP